MTYVAMQHQISMCLSLTQNQGEHSGSALRTSITFLCLLSLSSALNRSHIYTVLEQQPSYKFAELRAIKSQKSRPADLYESTSSHNAFMRLLWLLLSYLTFNLISGLSLQDSDLELLDGQPQQGVVQEEAIVYHVVLDNNSSSVKVKTHYELSEHRY
jgi:hypothetical protein